MPAVDCLFNTPRGSIQVSSESSHLFTTVSVCVADDSQAVSLCFHSSGSRGYCVASGPTPICLPSAKRRLILDARSGTCLSQSLQRRTKAYYIRQQCRKTVRYTVCTVHHHLSHCDSATPRSRFCQGRQYPSVILYKSTSSQIETEPSYSTELACL